jgi:hypothetical protein
LPLHLHCHSSEKAASQAANFIKSSILARELGEPPFQKASD